MESWVRFLRSLDLSYISYALMIAISEAQRLPNMICVRQLVISNYYIFMFKKRTWDSYDYIGNESFTREFCRKPTPYANLVCINLRAYTCISRILGWVPTKFGYS